jgi:predicted amidohydrolase YtcJ
VQPPHAVEDAPWAETRLGADRVRGAYAWRTLRRAGARLVFSADLPGSDWSLGYGLHSAITRTDTSGAPAGGWRASERMTIEEAVRGYTTWAAYSGHDERGAGALTVGRRADVTVLSADPFTMALPRDLLRLHATMSVVRGRIVFEGTPPR